ncbi:MaoC family dehydratase (plasmid) [Vibrio tubiashii]|uniref:MaoC family dehydratase n=1 Tax=Vibrio tubiashii TaxID=29498 RepID=UPI00234E5BA9|nr:MaoC family dehydratase [Vibrio tubiashii]WCP70215.1 MaoC family dehydratase [Vibrio tubiashii]
MNVISKDDIAHYIGVETEPTEWFVVSQAQINQFADCTLDHQFIHTDPIKAQDTMFGSTIAHGLLSLSMLPHFAERFGYQLEGASMGINYGFDKVRFIHPVTVNSRIRARAKLLTVDEKRPGHYTFKSEVVVEIEGEKKPALVAVWLAVQIVPE